MAISDSGRAQGDPSQANGSSSGSGGTWSAGPGFSEGTFGKRVASEPEQGQPLNERDPFADDQADPNDPFGEDIFGDETADDFGAPAASPAPPATAVRDDELDLGDDEMRLPWLEGDDEDYEDERGGLGQTTLLLILALVAILLLVGGIVWAMRNSSGKDLVADGGVIEAPAEPYKSRPENPGGEIVDGTGDSSFAVAEGESRTPQIAEPADPAPGPGFELENTEATPSPEPSEPASSGVGVQVGAYTSKASAEKGWATLTGQFAPLGEIRHRVLKGQADFGTVYRLQAVPGDRAAARKLCKDMEAAGLPCTVKD